MHFVLVANAVRTRHPRVQRKTSGIQVLVLLSVAEEMEAIWKVDIIRALTTRSAMTTSKSGYHVTSANC